MNYDKLVGNSVQNNGEQRVIGRPFPKGVSGNPQGRPPKSLMQRELEKIANDPIFAEAWVEAAKQRSLATGVAGFLMSREMLDRVDGPVKQEMDISVTLGLAETLSKARQRLEE